MHNKNSKRSETDKSGDLNLMVQSLLQSSMFDGVSQINSFPNFTPLLERVDMVSYHKWITQQKKRAASEM